MDRLVTVKAFLRNVEQALNAGTQTEDQLDILQHLFEIVEGSDPMAIYDRIGLVDTPYGQKQAACLRDILHLKQSNGRREYQFSKTDGTLFTTDTKGKGCYSNFKASYLIHLAYACTLFNRWHLSSSAGIWG